MQTALTLILIAAIGLQAMLGCCCRVAQFVCGTSGVAAAQGPACCDQACHDAPESPAPSHPPCQECGDCAAAGVYIAPAKSTLAQPDPLISCWLPATVTATFGESDCVAADRRDAGRELQSGQPIYLLHQLLLL